jgi:coniferyl-aldehyde dehydrogenase
MAAFFNPEVSMAQLASALNDNARDSGQQPRSSASPEAELRATFDRMRKAQRDAPVSSYEERKQNLDKLIALVRDNQQRIADAIDQDFSHRSTHETKIAEILMMVTAMKEMRKHLKGWMKPKSRPVALTLKPASAKVHYQPLGVVGVISPWNYTMSLALVPAATALAAGNRVMIKPSELTPNASALMAELIGQTFPADLISVVTGGVAVGQAFSELPFDHLLYTGSTRIGKLVMQAAAKNLTPVTLELGGKSPTIIHESFPVDVAAERIAFGKWLNAGQTCIAPDYLLVPESKRDAIVAALQRVTAKMYPSVKDNPDYSAIINPAHHQRLRGYVEDAVARGAKKIEVKPSDETLEGDARELRKIAPTILLDVSDAMVVMQEEIFGPLLPVVTYRTLDEAIEYVNDRPRPLALYYFDYDDARAKSVLERTTSGGACVNDTVNHFAIESLPFGGVGPSGMGAYHGFEGFETFSHKKSVLYQSRFSGAGLVAPPFGPRVEKLLRFLIGK